MVVYLVVKGVNFEGEDINSCEVFANKADAEKRYDEMESELNACEYVNLETREVK